MGRPLRNAHAAASRSAIALSTSTSCRREKTRNECLRRSAMRQIGFQNVFDDARCVFGDNVAIEFAAERGVRTEAAADQNVIALDRIVVFVRLDLAGEQTDLRDKMLGAGMMAAGQMNIDRRIDEDASRTRLRCPRRGVLCRRQRICSRCCRYTQRGRNGSHSFGWRARAPRCALAPPQAFQSERRRSGGFARPSAADRRRRGRARWRRARAFARPTFARRVVRRRSISAPAASARGCRCARCNRTQAAARPRPALAFSWQF